MMDDKLLVDTAVRAGEIMLSSGAETYRVEDTMARILAIHHPRANEAFVLATGITLSLTTDSDEKMTIVKRIRSRNTNLYRVFMVNEVSRQLCAGKITLEEAYGRLEEIANTRQYSKVMQNVGYVGVAVFFTLLLGGNLPDCVCAAIVGCVLAVVIHLVEWVGVNSFCENALSSMMLALTAMALGQTMTAPVNTDLVIIGTLMSLVPGTIFTNAVRDTLNGDYSSGVARMMEAVVVALAIAVGVGAGIALFHYVMGGGAL